MPKIVEEIFKVLFLLLVWTAFVAIASGFYGDKYGDIAVTYWVLGWWLFPVAYVCVFLISRISFFSNLFNSKTKFLIVASVLIVALYYPLWFLFLNAFKAVLNF